MDKDITEMFESKNREIFINSLTLEMERNLNTLKSTTDNIVALEINKLILFFKKFIEENNIKYSLEELIGFLYKEKLEINKIINDRIEQKKNNIKEDFYKNEIPEKIITDKFLIKYSEKLKEETASLNDDLKVRLKEKTCLELYPDLLKRLKLNNLSAKERVNSRINILFVDAIINRVSDEAKFRDDSLNNFSKESFRKYVELNKQTLNK
jgi:hypothetical protein